MTIPAIRKKDQEENQRENQKIQVQNGNKMNWINWRNWLNKIQCQNLKLDEQNETQLSQRCLEIGLNHKSNKVTS